jgi:hypothetical protein
VFIPGGLVPASAQIIDSAGVGTDRQTDGHFGGSELFPSGNTLAAADIDRDGQADLFIGEPGASVGGVANAGLVGIRYGVKVGIFALAPADTTVAAGDRLTYTLTWTHPENWHELATLDLRLTGDDGTIAWVRWDEVSNTFSLLDPSTGQFGPAAAPGSDKKLRAGVVTLELADSTVVGSGPTGRSVTLTLRLRLDPQTPLGAYRLELLATDDHGNAQGFEQAGVLHVVAQKEAPAPAGISPVTSPPAPPAPAKQRTIRGRWHGSDPEGIFFRDPPQAEETVEASPAWAAVQPPLLTPTAFSFNAPPVLNWAGPGFPMPWNQPHENWIMPPPGAEGGGTFQVPQTVAVSSNPFSPPAADFNRDGMLDLAVFNDNDSQASSVSALVLRNEGYW